MSSLLKFEQNLETALVDHFNVNGIQTHGSRSVENLGANNVQVSFEYNGALEDSRQTVTLHPQTHQFAEFNLHTGSMQIRIVTYREDQHQHFDRVAKIRELMFKHKQPFKECTYQIYEIKPEGSATLEDEEMNADQTDLSYQIHFRIDLNELKVDTEA
jgi:hypothetical protein